jgi:hypothetical protein
MVANHQLPLLRNAVSFVFSALWRGGCLAGRLVSSRLSTPLETGFLGATIYCAFLFLSNPNSNLKYANGSSRS